MDVIPLELIFAILSHLSDDQQSLTACTLVSHAWRSCALPLLYHAPTFANIQSIRIFADRIPTEAEPMVREIDLSAIPHRWDCVTDKILARLMEKCKAIERIDLHLCSKIHDSSVYLISTTLGSTLTDLTLSQCERLTNASVFALAAHCPCLKTLDISHLLVTDVSLRELAESCTSLEWLSLAYCEFLTEASIMFLRERCARLKFVDLDGCYGMLFENDDDNDMEEYQWTQEANVVIGKEYEDFEGYFSSDSELP
ncbi:hypothetical protein BC936DRAFT_137067 [Jimgerdemannia flammicorona]|uniref:F-box domain-containing protein n=1 Tax=Jimgerdemannia flammicorona TaxID=994334 RepID=A0A433CY52_9FUNG|nr:hypothetical protein BC936DRAFT_137067 [Jimgerdemannia flammicorona]